MALVPASDPVAGTSRWLPTHVQVTVLRARGLRGKSSGAGSTSDAYTVIQLGREKYSTSVVEKTPGCPEWREECSFELPPGALDGLLRAQESDAGPAPWAAPPGACELLLTTWHRSLIGVDKFLGRATVALDQVFGAGRAQHTEWYKLHSKAGKKEKERGEIQVTIRFTRNNLSASMFDLSVKDKPRSPFSKIKDKVRGKKKFDLESASAILPSSAVEDPELGSLGRMGKAKGFFLRDKLRKSSLTQSSTSLGSASTLSSASGSLAYQGPGAELLTRSPSRTSWLSTDGGRDSTVSPKLLTHKRTYSDEASQVRVAAPRALLDLQGHVDTASRSSLCINGGHIYIEQPPELLRHRSSISGPFPPSSSLLSISSRPSEEGSRSVDDSWGRGGRRASSSEAGPGQEPSAQPRVLALGASRSGEEEGALLSAGRPVQVTPPLGASSEATAEKEGAWKEERKPRMGLFHHHPGLSRSELGRRSSLGEKGSPTLGASPHHSSSGEEKAKSSWFGLREAKEAPQKPSAARASPTPLASPGQSLTDWDDTFNVFAASRLCPEVRSQSLAPAAVGLEVTGLQAPNPAAVTVKVAESQGSLEGGGRDGSSMRLGPEQQRTRTADPEPLGSLGASLLSMSTQPHLRGSDSEPGGDSGPSPADSVTSLFSSPEVISVWERLPGTACAPEARDGEVSRGDSQLFQELSTASDSWPWDVVTVSPTPDTSSPVLRGESDELSPKLQTEAPDAVSPTGSARLPPQKRDPEPELQRVSEEEGLQPSTPPPKPPRLFTPGGSQVEEEDDEDITERLCAWGPEASVAALAPSLGLGPGEPREEPGEPTSEESDGHSSETLLGELGQEDVIPEDASPPPASGSCLSLPTGCPEGPVSIPARSESPVLDTGEAAAAPQAQSQGLAEGELRPPSACSQQKGTLNPFLSHGGREPPSFPSTSPPGSRDSSIHPGPEELPTLPEPAFPPPHLPPRASHPDGGPSPQCPPLPGAQPLASSSPPSGALASPPRPSEPSTTGGPPAPLAPPGEDLAAAIPASPLALLPLETRPAEEPLLPASPHLVKPLSAAPAEGSTDRKSARSSLSTALSSGLEKLKTVTSGSVQPVAPAPQSGQAVEAKRLKDSGAPDQSAKYYHLTHDELIGLLLQRERELSQRDEHVQALESYIDRLLVRIMETSPTLLQIPAAAPPE